MYLLAARPDKCNVLGGIWSDQGRCIFQQPREFFNTCKVLLILGCTIGKKKKLDMIGFTNSDHAGDSNGRKSTSGYVFMLGSRLSHGHLRSSRLSLYRQRKFSL